MNKVMIASSVLAVAVGAGLGLLNHPVPATGVSLAIPPDYFSMRGDEPQKTASPAKPDECPADCLTYVVEQLGNVTRGASHR